MIFLFNTLGTFYFLRLLLEKKEKGGNLTKNKKMEYAESKSHCVSFQTTTNFTVYMYLLTSSPASANPPISSDVPGTRLPRPITGNPQSYHYAGSPIQQRWHVRLLCCVPIFSSTTRHILDLRVKEEYGRCPFRWRTGILSSPVKSSR